MLLELLLEKQMCCSHYERLAEHVLGVTACWNLGVSLYIWCTFQSYTYFMQSATSNSKNHLEGLYAEQANNSLHCFLSGPKTPKKIVRWSSVLELTESWSSRALGGQRQFKRVIYIKFTAIQLSRKRLKIFFHLIFNIRSFDTFPLALLLFTLMLIFCHLQV